MSNNQSSVRKFPFFRSSAVNGITGYCSVNGQYLWQSGTEWSREGSSVRAILSKGHRPKRYKILRDSRIFTGCPNPVKIMEQGPNKKSGDFLWVCAMVCCLPRCGLMTFQNGERSNAGLHSDQYFCFTGRPLNCNALPWTESPEENCILTFFRAVL